MVLLLTLTAACAPAPGKVTPAPAPDEIAPAIGVGYLAGWYFSLGKSQIKYVKEKVGGAYERKKWRRPLGIALLVFFGATILLGVALAPR